MGEVYRARDPRLNRTVAIKILASLFQENPDRRERFLRPQAQAVAALEHRTFACSTTSASRTASTFS
mgnify:CR=1 FL=1